MLPQVEDDDSRPLAASYSRFSSENQSDSSIDDQRRRCREHAEKLGLKLPEEFEYADFAISGTKLRREGLDRLVADAKAGKFETLIVFSLSRLGRESIITMPFLKKLVYENKIRFISVSETIDSAVPNWELFTTFLNLQHENYVKELSANVLRGQEGALLDGFAVGDHRFGYRSIPSPKGELTGRGRNAKPRMVYVIDEERAEWVRRIFIWFVEERRPISWIVRELNRLKAPKDHRSSSPRWHFNLVSGILGSSKYIGQWPWGLKKNNRMPSTGLVKQVNRPESETNKWRREIPELRIIGDELFFAAQTIRAMNAQRIAPIRKPNGRLRGRSAGGEPQHLLAGLIQCKSCGSTFHTCGSGATYMGCSGAKRGTCDCRTTVPRKLATKLILDVVSTEITSNPTWLAQVTELTRKAIETANREVPALRTQLQQQLNEIELRISKLLDLGELRPSEELSNRLESREREKAGIQRQLRDLERSHVETPRMPTSDWVVQQLNHLIGVLALGTPAATHALHNLIVGQIEVGEVAHENRKRCHLRGTLKIRIGRLAVEFGSTIPEIVNVGTAGNGDVYREVSINFREKTKTEAQGEVAWSLFQQQRLIKDIAAQLNVSRARVTVILKSAAKAQGVAWGDGRHRLHTLIDRPRSPTRVDKMLEPVMAMFHEGILLSDIARQLDLDRNLVTATVARWHEQQGLPVPDGRTRRKSLEVKSSSKSTN